MKITFDSATNYKTFKCNDCNTQLSRQDAKKRVVGWSCPTCLFDAMPSSVPRIINGRCSRNCWECPCCASVVLEGKCGWCGWQVSKEIMEKLKGMSTFQSVESSEQQVFDSIRTHFHNVLFTDSRVDKTRMQDRATRVQLLIKKARLTASLKNTTDKTIQQPKRIDVDKMEETLKSLALEKREKEWSMPDVDIVRLGELERERARTNTMEDAISLTTRQRLELPISPTSQDLQELYPMRTKLRCKFQHVCPKCDSILEHDGQVPLIYLQNDVLYVKNPTDIVMQIKIHIDSHSSSIYQLHGTESHKTTLSNMTLIQQGSQLKLFVKPCSFKVEYRTDSEFHSIHGKIC